VADFSQPLARETKDSLLTARSQKRMSKSISRKFFIKRKFGYMECIIMRELNVNEIEQVSGGFLPLLAAVYSIATGTAVRSFGGYVLNRAATTYAIYSAAESYGGGDKQ
jgi:hypothetical protein